jgi:hypothetical protein
MNEQLDREIDVNELIQSTLTQELSVCRIPVMRPVYQQGPDGMVYSCAMSNATREQGFINGIPFCSISYVPVSNGICGSIAELPSLHGSCVNIGCSIDLNNVIIVPPDFQKG